MNIHHTIDTVILILKDNEILYCPQVVTNMLSARGAEARENTFFHLFEAKFSTQRRELTRLKEISKQCFTRNSVYGMVNNVLPT